MLRYRQGNMRSNMSGTRTWLAPTTFVVAMLFAGCSGHTIHDTATGSPDASTHDGGSGDGTHASPKPAAVCKFTSECDAPLVCIYGICHTQCEQTRDCPPDQRCIMADSGNICLLAVESHCTHNSDCLEPLVCAKNGTCRNQCMANRDCAGGQICAKSQVCADPSELDATGDLKPP